MANKLRVKITLNGELEKYILKKLETDWSPEQIVERLKTELESNRNSNRVGQPNSLGFSPTLSYQTIYNHIYLIRPHWKKYPRIINSKGKYCRKYGTKVREKLREESKKKRIDVRPEIINTRGRLGNFEGDTIVGGEKPIHILTHIDRKSGYLVANKAETVIKESIAQSTRQSLKELPKTKVKNITYDNGVQFEKHQDTEQKLQKNQQQ